MKLKFIHPTAAQVMRVLSIVIAVANTVLTLGATLTGVPSWLGWLTAYWPVIYGVAIVLHQAASTFGVNPDANVETLLKGLLTNGSQLATLITAVQTAAKASALPATPTTPTAPEP